MDYTNLERETGEFVTKTFASSVDHQYPYHNLRHTVSVVEHAGEIAKFYELKAGELFIVRVAGWFHDIGHLYGGFEGHEERGVSIMKGYMEQLGVSEALILAIAQCIRATKFPSHPGSIYEEIVCDSDTYHFGTAYFRQTDVLVRQEVELRTGKSFPDWHKKSIRLLEYHHYFTAYCQELLDKGKQENIQWLRSLTD